MTTRRRASCAAAALVLLLLPEGAAPAEPVSRPYPRPAWMKDGILAASSMEPLLFIIRRGGQRRDAIEWYRDQRTEKAVQKLKDVGVNLMIVNLHKAAGFQAEAEDIESARKFTELLHRMGIKSGGYVGASLAYETLFEEIPEARDWMQIDEYGRPVYYTSEQTFRYMACRNNPGYQEFIRRVLRLGIQDLKMDLMHFDQLQNGMEPQSCRCRYCREQFREFLRQKYPAQLARMRFGYVSFNGVIPPPFGIPEGPVRLDELRNPLMQEWELFRCQSLARQFGEYEAYIKKLNPQVALIGNPPMYPSFNNGFMRGVDHQLLLQHGDFIWSEEPNAAEWTADERLVSKIRTYKLARTMGKSVIRWQINTVGVFPGPLPLRLAEATAYTEMNLGALPWQNPMTEQERAEVRKYSTFMRANAADLYGTQSVEDVAVLHSFPSLEFNPAKGLVGSVLFEQALIQGKIPFGLIFDRNLKDLSGHKVLVLANQDAISDEQLEDIRKFVRNGGGLVATEDSTLLTDWRTVREGFGLADLFGLERPPAPSAPNRPVQRQFGKGRVVYIPRIEAQLPPPPPRISYNFPNQFWKLPRNYADLIQAVKWAAGDRLSASVEAPLWVTIELTRQPATNTYMLHVLNFKHGTRLAAVPAEVRIPAGYQVKEATVKNPDSPASALQIEQQQDVARFRIPELETYVLVTLRLARR